MDTILLSHKINECTPTYKNRDKVRIINNSSIKSGDSSNTSKWIFSNNHIGTHIDVPNHFFDEGRTLTEIEPNEWVYNNVAVIDIECKKSRLIEVEEIDERCIDPKAELILIRTGYEEFRNQARYWKNYPSLSPELCKYLRNKYKSLRAIGVDIISITSTKFRSSGIKAHEILLKEVNNRFITIIEDMKLKDLKFNPSKVIVAPLLMDNTNGSPATIFALK